MIHFTFHPRHNLWTENNELGSESEQLRLRQVTTKIRTQQGTRGYGGKEMDGCNKINLQQLYPHYRCAFVIHLAKHKAWTLTFLRDTEFSFVTHPEAVTAACDLRWLQAGAGQPVAVVCYLLCDLSMTIRAFRSVIKL